MNYSSHDLQISHIHIHPYSPSYSGLYVSHSCLEHSALIGQLQSWCQEIRHQGQDLRMYLSLGSTSCPLLWGFSLRNKKQQSTWELCHIPHFPESPREAACVSTLGCAYFQSQQHLSKVTEVRVHSCTQRRILSYGPLDTSLPQLSISLPVEWTQGSPGL